MQLSDRPKEKVREGLTCQAAATLPDLSHKTLRLKPLVPLLRLSGVAFAFVPIPCWEFIKEQARWEANRTTLENSSSTQRIPCHEENLSMDMAKFRYDLDSVTLSNPLCQRINSSYPHVEKPYFNFHNQNRLYRKL